jgi:succinate dehydrogenase/fumarate reductase flavoprotein subunit
MDNMQSLLMSTLAGGGSNREDLMQQLLQQADLDESTLELLTKYLSERAEPEANDSEEDESRYEEQEERILRLTELLGETSEQLQRVYAEVEELRSVKSDLSVKVDDLEEFYYRLTAALGICYQCLGDDESCQICGGKGYAGSGFFRLDEDLFSYYVLPVVRLKMNSQRRNNNNKLQHS